MSRAFVGDDQYDSADDEAPELKVPIPAGSRNYLTPEGAAALAGELGRLETEERPRLASEIDRLGKAAGKDAPDALSNARRALNKVDRRIEYLSRMASIAETVEPPSGGYASVRFGATATVGDADGGLSEYRIVGVDEADPERGLIGWTSPIARALIGKKPGDEAVAALPDGERRLVVVAVR
ncbi:MAG: GreA/GreB family elongation factor [Spirochaetes bacterium]|nr:GreA/GreB family elongation factor [Spirochaetota bacterium]MBU1079828.1 GreA/GreB family elongation factor [Spirochaetota bacterium]